MMPISLTTEYLAALERALPQSPQREVGPSAIDLSDFLPQSQQASQTLAAALRAAQTPEERSMVEVQLLAAAAADLAIADAQLAEVGPAQRESATLTPLIWQGLTDPAALLRPSIQPARYRGADRDLLAAIYQVLNGIQEATTETVADAITAALTMNVAVLREAAKLAGMDIKQVLEDLGADEAVALVIEAWRKLGELIGEDNMEKLQATVGEAIEKLREKAAVSAYVARFLDTETIYQTSRQLVQGYDGPDKDLARLTPQILTLEGSFAGRNKLAATLIRLLTLAKLAKALRTPPWGPLIVASGYVLIIGYELYSAHDHVDSDRFPFFDRVAGVQTLVQKELGSKER